ncbi:uncharacterized protein LOC134846420 [Symsagittifera roscoffensis]|uniref:uncharacterized protein LOC134846420 n=1 Tax=Symsagittifera roscoffensis TaxID=84072 RepID=UPI00307B4DE4
MGYFAEKGTTHRCIYALLVLLVTPTAVVARSSAASGRSGWSNKFNNNNNNNYDRTLLAPRHITPWDPENKLPQTSSLREREGFELPRFLVVPAGLQLGDNFGAWMDPLEGSRDDDYTSLFPRTPLSRKYFAPGGSSFASNPELEAKTESKRFKDNWQHHLNLG